MPLLEELNRLSKEKAIAELLRCCGSRRWATLLVDARPFVNKESLFAAAQAVWNSLAPADWLEAFSGHPRIGEKRAAGWAMQEQASSATASPRTLEALATGNEAYEKRFGHVFLVCATGKSTEEILSQLEARLPNDPKQELGIAAIEQGKITRLRLEKLLGP